MSNYRVEDEAGKLTIEEMNAYDMYHDIDEVFAQRRGVPWTKKFVKGLPVGLEKRQN
jgi:salicylate hydroxylase